MAGRYRRVSLRRHCRTLAQPTGLSSQAFVHSGLVTALPPIQELISGRPTSCFGMEVSWPSMEDPTPVFVESFELQEGRRAYVFGARYDIAGALFDGDSLGDGHIVEYFVVTPGLGSWRCARLMQHEDVVYSATLEPAGHVPAGEVDAPERSMGEPPRWISRTAAIWPTHGSEPMLFVGQAALPANNLTGTLRAGTTIYLFRSHDGEDDFFALVDQLTSEQSAEEHYAMEEEFD